MDNLALSIFSPSINTHELDNKPCALCGETPTDLSSRIDCDGAGKKGTMLMTYHKKCWLKACRNYVSA